MAEPDWNDIYQHRARLVFDDFDWEGDRALERPISDLVLGMKCGGSDGFSGITANPLVGAVSDLVTGWGGTVLLTDLGSTNGTIVNGQRVSEVVLADIDIIRRAPADMTASGYADLLAKVTAGADWILADPPAGHRVIPAVDIVLQPDGDVEGLAREPGERRIRAAASLRLQLAVRVVDQVVLQRAAGVDHIADGVLVIAQEGVQRRGALKEHHVRRWT